MKILVTGGLGFIGSAVIRYIIKHSEHEVMNFDKMTYASNQVSLCEVEHSARYHFIQGDICNKNAIKKVLQSFRPHRIMHLAAETHVDRSIQDPSQFLLTNVLGTFTLLELVREYSNSLSEQERSNFLFHHISTDEVYGDLDVNHLPFTENSPYMPSSPYSASKAGADHLVRAWSRTYGINVVISNCSNNYGPYQYPEKLIPHMILNAFYNRKLPIYGDGLQIRDWLFVEDHACALFQIITTRNISGTYNIGGNCEMSNLEVVKLVCDLLDEFIAKEKGVGFKHSELIQFVPDRLGHDRRYAVDSSKLMMALSWKPKETFETGLRKTIKWYLERENQKLSSFREQ